MTEETLFALALEKPRADRAAGRLLITVQGLPVRRGRRLTSCASRGRAGRKLPRCAAQDSDAFNGEVGRYFALSRKPVGRISPTESERHR